MKQTDLIYDWNHHPDNDETATGSLPKRVEVDDETLRDGLQSPSAINPPIDDKLKIIHFMAKLGIHSADIGYPSSSKQAFEDVLRIAKEILDKNLKIDVGCAARTVAVDIDPIIEISQRVGIPIEVQAFIGSSPIRCYVEDWETDKLLQLTKEAVGHTVKNGLDVMYVTEDTTRSMPEVVRDLYTAAIENGAKRICVCDTVGHTTPRGVRNLIGFVKGIVRESGENIKVDWHGHNDRGLSVSNSIAAIESGVDRVHGTILGLGERAGNTPLDLLLVNMKLVGRFDHDLTALSDYCRFVSKTCGAPLPDNYPVIGKDAFRTATGVHAAAIIKAYEKEETSWLRDAVYSAVPASEFGREQLIEIGPMSGKANVIFWLNRRGYKPSTDIVENILNTAKRSNRSLTDEEIEAIVKE